MRWMLCCLCLLVGGAFAAPLDVPLRLERPAGVTASRWPVTVGVPLPRGLLAPGAALTVATVQGQAVPCQVTTVSTWPGGSPRWVQVAFLADLAQTYRLREGAPPAAADDLRVATHPGGVTVTTGGAVYTFARDQGCFVSLTLGGETLVDDGGEAFYAVDSQGRRAVLQATELTVERSGPRQAVVRVRGEYRTAKGERTAAATVYYTFHAGLPGVRIAHKLIFTEETLDLWFRDLGVAFPLRPGKAPAATVATHHDTPSAHLSVPLGRGEELLMLQSDFPHFGWTGSTFVVDHLEGRHAARLLSAAAGGDWAALGGERHGLAVQLPAFAEQFPTAFRLAPDRLTLKFWASECGRELDFRTPNIIRDYFGHDWIPADHKLMQTSNTARGAARTHEFWLYPHAGRLTPAAIAEFGATRQEIYAVADPAWVCASGAIDQVLPYDPQRHPREEQAIEEYVQRNVLLPERVFPNTGYLGWGRNPYTSASFERRNGRWYPQVHRLGRYLNYNFRRVIWVFYARSGDRRYRDYARPYTRFMHDFGSSNYDTPLKPLGWFIQGLEWDSPCIWGAFSEQTIRENRRAEMISNVSCLGYGTSEDVINFVYDWFMTGDFHSRDAALAYKEALLKELGTDVEKALAVTPSYVLLRPLGSAYEIDGDQRLYDYGHAFLQRIVGDGQDVLDLAHPQNYAKEGEIWAGFYHYYTSTGDELALGPVHRVAERYYRTNRFPFFGRGSVMLACFALEYQRTGDPAYLAWLREGIRQYLADTPTLADRGVNPATLGPDFPRPWGHDGAMTNIVSLGIALPLALRASDQASATVTPAVPLAVKPHPTARTGLAVRKPAAGPERIDLYLNNFAEPQVVPRLLDGAGREVPVTIAARTSLRPHDPRGDADWQHYHNHLYNLPGDHHYFRLEFAGPPGDYLLDVGTDVAATVLYSTLDRWTQLAPDGVALLPRHRYFFPVAPGTQTVEFFAHRPVRVLNPFGDEAPVESLGAGRWRVATRELAGTWGLLAAADKFAWDYPHQPVQSYLRFLSQPTLLALDDPARLFPADPARLPSAIPADLPAAGKEPAWTAGRFGQGLLLGSQRGVKVPPGQLTWPGPTGTIEFWLRSHGSATDLHHLEPKFSHQHQHLLRLDPLLLTYDVASDSDGRTERYSTARLTAFLLAGKRQPSFPATLYLQAGRWYHLAVTWQVDGRDSAVSLYVNGRRQSYGSYLGGIPAELKPEELASPTAPLRFGAGVYMAYVPFAGQTFDELRVSRTVRYRDDFAAPTAPFALDADTVLLLHLDGDLAGQTPTGPVTAEPDQFGKLQ